MIYLMYAHEISATIQRPRTKLQIFATAYKPVRPNNPDKMYIITATIPYTAAVRIALKTFLLSFCALN